ncbi:MAG: signal peptidase II [Burkholderiales bacterium]|nr:signal peptidase II [Burkholderiales bacterium]
MSRRDASRALGAAWVVAAIVVALDQWTKHLVQQALVYGESVRVTGFLDLVLVYNPGAAFSFLAGASGWQREFFIAIALFAVGFITWMIVRHRDKPMFVLALSLLLGGAIGNLIDRVVLTAVVDFLHFHAGPWYWPAFNVADSAISVGAVLLVRDSFRTGRVEPPTPSTGES